MYQKDETIIYISYVSLLQFFRLPAPFSPLPAFTPQPSLHFIFIPFHSLLSQPFSFHSNAIVSLPIPPFFFFSHFFSSLPLSIFSHNHKSFLSSCFSHLSSLIIPIIVSQYHNHLISPLPNASWGFSRNYLA